MKITFVHSLEMTLSLVFFCFFCRRKRAWWWGKVQDTLRADPFGCSVFHFYSRLRFRHQEYLQKRVRHQYQTTLHAYLCNASSFNCGETEKKRPLFDTLDCPTLASFCVRPKARPFIWIRALLGRSRVQEGLTQTPHQAQRWYD